MAATKKKPSASRASGQSGAQKKNKSPAKKGNRKKTAQEMPPVVPREMWAAIYGVLGLLCLIAVLKRDGAVLRLIHTALGGMVGWGIDLCPFALFGIAALLLVRRKGPVRLRGQPLRVHQFCLVRLSMRCSADRTIQMQGLPCSVCWEMVQNCRQEDCWQAVYTAFCAGRFLESEQCFCSSLV